MGNKVISPKWETNIKILNSYGWSIGYVQILSSDGLFWIIDAIHFKKNLRYVIKAKTLVSGFIKLKNQIMTKEGYLE